MNTKMAGIKAQLRLQSRFKGLTYFFWSKKKCWEDGQPKSKGEKVLLVSDFPNFEILKSKVFNLLTKFFRL